MNNRVILTLAWLTSTVVMMAVTYSAVNLVGSQVTDQPIQANLIADTTIADRVSVEASTTTTSSPERIASSTSAPDIPIRSSSTSTTSSEATPSPTPTTTSTSTTSTTSTSAPPPDVEITGPFPVSSGGGVITVSCSGNEISFLGATPSAGYSMQVEDHGPREVRVRFSSTENEWMIEVRCRNGVIEPKVDLQSI